MARRRRIVQKERPGDKYLKQLRQGVYRTGSVPSSPARTRLPAIPTLPASSYVPVPVTLPALDPVSLETPSPRSRPDLPRPIMVLPASSADPGPSPPSSETGFTGLVCPLLRGPCVTIQCHWFNYDPDGDGESECSVLGLAHRHNELLRRVQMVADQLAYLIQQLSR